MCSAFVLGVTFLACATAIDMTGCGDNSPLEVTEDTENYVITCNNIGGTSRRVVWFRAAEVSAGYCDSDLRCYPVFAAIAKLSRPSYSTSTMTVKSATRLAWGNRVVSCVTKQPPAPNVVTEDSCTLDVIYPAEASCSVQTNRWTVGGSCSISKVYSSASRYSCQFFTGSQSSQTTPVTQSTPYTPQPHQDSDYRTGSCDFSNVALSPTKGDYYYKAVIVPGNVQKVFGPVMVDPPTKPSFTCTPSSWVPDGSTVSCTCSTSNLGQPAGKLQGFRGSSMVAPGSDDGSLSLTLPAQTVNRGDHGNSKAQFSCVADWIQDKTSDIHNVPVAWGPANVTIPQSTAFNTDSTGSKQLTLTCNANDVNPTGDLLTYSWTSRCQGSTGSTCTFQPRPPGDDGMEVTCTVTNSYNNNQQRSYTYQLNLNYPPLQAPVITRSPSSQPLYSTDALTLTCEVTGGKPLVTSVSLSCSSCHPDNPNDVTRSDSLSSSLQMPLTADDDNITCSCAAVWKLTPFYTLSDSTTLTVYYPPSTPVISRTDGLAYPYLAGDRVEMTCDTQPSRGNPEASLTWSGHGGGQTQTSSGAPTTLLFPSVGRGDNRRNITCRASNDFTQVKGQTHEDSWILDVFYPPVIGVSGVQNTNDCQLSAEKTQCVVTEGRRVHINSTADSNPDPETFRWRKQADSGLDLGTTSVLDIVSTNHVLHNGLYNLTVTSGDLGNGRDRLTESKELNILVLYAPETTELTLNTRTHDLTLSEGDRADFTCRTNGRPSPSMQLVDVTSGKAIQSTAGGELTVEDKVTWLNHSLTAACQHTGTYNCDVSNDVDNGPRGDVSLFVNCKPRRASAPPETVPTVTYEGRPIALPFDLIAFPTPDTFSFKYLGRDGANASREVDGLDITLSPHCTSERALFMVTCIVTVNHVTNSSVGVYRARFANAFGFEEVDFKVTPRDRDVILAGNAEAVSNGLSAGAAVGVTVALVVVGVAAAVVWMWRRHWVLPCASTVTKAGGAQDLPGGQQTPTPEGAPETDGLQNSSVYEIENNSVEDDPPVPSNYEHLKLQDVGSRSVYSGLNPYVNTRGEADLSTGPLYQNTQ